MYLIKRRPRNTMLIKPYNPVTPPIPSKPTDWAADKVTYPAVCQPKMNGVKALLSPEGKLYLKSAERRPHLEQYGGCGHWIDCELWHPHMDLGTIAGLVNRHASDNETAKLQLWMVDLINPYVAQADRLLAMEILLPSLSNAEIIISWVCNNGFEAAEHYKRIQNNDAYDGMIYRNYRAVYQFGKTDYVLKRKKELDGEYLCIGVTEGMGKFFGMLGSFQLRDDKGNEFSCGGGDLTVADRQAFWKQPPINQYIQVRFPYYSTNNIPQCPQFTRIRNNPAV